MSAPPLTDLRASPWRPPPSARPCAPWTQLRSAAVTCWPERASAEIRGAHRADHQNRGEGKRGAANSFGWMFETLGVRLIGVTAALDNPRSARVIEAAGFRFMCERDSVRPDGASRCSRYWELIRDEWRAQLVAVASRGVVYES